MRSAFLLLSLSASLILQAQAPQAISYQAVLRNTNGDPLPGRTITPKFDIVMGGPIGLVVYSEYHAPPAPVVTTDEQGMFSVRIGEGHVLSGDMTAIDWGANHYWLNVAVDTTGGLGFVHMGSQQLVSVPYALHAGSVAGGTGDDDWTIEGDTLSSGMRRVGIGTDSPKGALHVHGGPIAFSGPGLATMYIGAGAPGVIGASYGNFCIGPGFPNNVGGYENTAIGIRSMTNLVGGGHNTALGSYTMDLSTSAAFNTAIGSNALMRSEGNSSVAVGAFSLEMATDQGFNTAVGASSMRRTTTGSRNTAMGSSALFENTIGEENTAIGTEAQRFAVTSFFNTSVGHGSLRNNLTGAQNTGVGHNTLANTTGSGNSAIGVNSGSQNQTGIFNTYLGSNTRPSPGNNYNFSTAIGESSVVSATDQIRIGTNFTTSIGGFQLWSNVSDGRYKLDVQENVLGLDLIMKLRPVTYRLDHAALINDLYDDPEFAAERMAQIAERGRNTTESGFIAQEVEAAARELGYSFNGVDAPKTEGDHYGLRYAAFVVPLVKAVQEQQAMIADLRAELLELQEQVRALTAEADH